MKNDLARIKKRVEAQVSSAFGPTFYRSIRSREGSKGGEIDIRFTQVGITGYDPRKV